MGKCNERVKQLKTGLFLLLSCLLLAPVVICAAHAEEVEPHPGGRVLEQTYDAERNGFVLTFPNKKNIVSSVPNGMVSNEAVELYSLEGDVLTIYRNGQVYISEQRNRIYHVEEDGNYTVRVENGAEMNRVENVSYCFSIITQSTDHLNILYAPWGMQFTEAYRDDIALNTQSGYIDMREDGVYKLTLRGENGREYTATIEKQEQPRLIQIKLEEEETIVTVSEENLEEVQVYRNGKRLEMEASEEMKFVDGGDYGIFVKDNKGNGEYRSFQIEENINAANVTTGLLLAALVGGVVFVTYRARFKQNVC